MDEQRPKVASRLQFIGVGHVRLHFFFCYFYYYYCFFLFFFFLDRLPLSHFPSTFARSFFSLVVVFFLLSFCPFQTCMYIRMYTYMHVGNTQIGVGGLVMLTHCLPLSTPFVSRRILAESCTYTHDGTTFFFFFFPCLSVLFLVF